MNGEPINVVLRRSNGVDEIKGCDFADLAEAASAAFSLAARLSVGAEAAEGETASVVIMVAHRVELVIHVTAGVPLWQLV